MPNYTKNYNLIKPNKTENYDIEDVTNKNMDILDEELFGKEDKVPGKGLSTNDFTNEYKNKLDGLENYDDTELINKLNEQVQKNNLQEQKIEELQSQITNLQEENTQLKDQIPTGEASGNPIHIADSTNLEAKLRLNGGDKQETREGSNLLNFNVEQNSKVTVNADGTLTINGTGGFSLNFEEITLKNGTTYYEKFELVSGNITGSNVFLSFNGTTWLNKSNFTNYTPSEDTKKSSLWIHQDAVFENAVVKIWANTDQSDFEQYGAMPSPGYPSKVETVGSNVNLFDGINKNYYINTVANLCGILEGNTGSIINVKGQSNITISSSIIQERFRAGCINSELTNETSVTLYNGINKDNGKEIVIDCTGYNYLVINATSLDSIKLEKGTKATPYSPYNMGSVEIEKSNKQLFNIKDLVKGMGALNLDEEDFVTVTVDNSSGSSQKYYNVYTNPSKLIKPNTKYYLVLEVKEISGTGNIMIHSFDATDHKPQFSGSKNYGFAALTKGTIKIDEITSLEDFSDSNSMLRTFLSYNAGQSGSITFRISVLEEEPTAETFEYTKHEQQTKIMPIQQEMLEGDYIENVEHHGWNKIVLDGTENIQTNPFGTNSFIITLPTSAPAKISETETIVLSTHFKGIALEDRGNSGDNVCYIESTGLTFTIRNTEFATLETFKAYLAEQYTAGTPITIYYKLATPLDLELTEKQKEAQKINTYNNVTNIVADNSLATLDVEYKKDQETLNKNYEDRIAVLEAAILS